MKFARAIATPVLPLLRSGTTFSPLSLFAANEPGVWYDPSDLSTLFQDAAGTTPVTAVEQPVGLVLDKSRGLVLGPELVSNGGPFAATTGWTPNNSTLSISSSKLRITPTGMFGSAAFAFSTTVGKWYAFTATSYAVSGTISASIRKSDTTNGNTNFVTSSSGAARKITIYAQATATTTYIFLLNGSAADAVVDWDTISARELPGSHAFQTTDINRPVLSARINGFTYTEDVSNAAWEKTNVSASNATLLLETTTNATHNAIQRPTFVSGVQYTIRYRVKPNGRTRVAIGGGSGLGGLASTGQFYDLTGSGSVVNTLSGISASITADADGYYTCSLTITPSSSGAIAVGIYLSDGGTNLSYAGDTSKGVYLTQADVRVSNDGVGLPAYQRVVDSTTYDTTGFPTYLRGDGADDALIGPAIDNVISASSYEACVGARFITVTTNSSQWLNQSLVTDNAAYVGIGAARSTGFIGAFNFDTNADEATVAMTAPATIVLQQRHSGGNLVISTNGGTEASVASGGTGALTGSLQLFKAFGAVYTNGRLYGVIIRNSAFTDAERASVRTWMNNVTKAY